MGQFTAIADLAKYKIYGHPAKMSRVNDNMWLGQGTKLTGEIMYFLPKDKSGNLIDTPRRLLQVGSSYYDADLVKAEPNANFTGLDDAIKRLSIYGADGNTSELSNTMNFDLSNADGNTSELSNTMNFDLLNADGLDESISNAIGINESESNFIGGSLEKNIRKSLEKGWHTAKVEKSPIYILHSIQALNTIVDLKSKMIRGVMDGKDNNTLKYMPRNISNINKGAIKLKAPHYFHKIVSLMESLVGEMLYSPKFAIGIDTSVSSILPTLIKNETEKAKEQGADKISLFLFRTIGYIDDMKVSHGIDGDYSNLTNESLLGADGDYSNVTNESLLNATGVGAVTAKRKTPKFIDKGRGVYYLEGHYDKGSKNTVKEIKRVAVFHPKRKSIEKIKLFIFDDGTAGIMNGWENTSSADGDYSNLTNESLLGADGDYSNVTDATTTKVADPNKAVVDEKTMLGMFKKSGTRKTFKEWIKSDSVKSAINTLVQLGGGLLNQQTGSSDINLGKGGNAPNPNDEFDSKNNPHEGVTILGMTPITFGIVSVVAIAIGAIVTVKLLKHK